MSIKESAKTKGYLKNLSSGSIMKFQFNPETFSYSRGVSFSEIISPGMAYPRTQYTHGNAKTFSIDLFFFNRFMISIGHIFFDIPHPELKSGKSFVLILSNS